MLLRKKRRNVFTGDALLSSLPPDENKPYLETAPYLIVIFAQHYEVTTDGRKLKNYYVTESVGIATGMLISAVHMAGLVTLTHTPVRWDSSTSYLDVRTRRSPFSFLLSGIRTERLACRTFRKNRPKRL